MKQHIKHGFIEEKDLPFQLGLLRKGVNYQKWIMQTIEPFLGNSILEIGAGIGNMSRWFPVRKKLIFSEVDPIFLPFLKNTIQQVFKNDNRVKTLKIDLDTDWKLPLCEEKIDTIVSFNVMEHVKNDKQFFSDLVSILKNSKSSNIKRLITFVPAHQFAYGSVDSGYGHYKRYSYKDLKRLKDEVIPEAGFYCRYFNLVGLPGWFVLGKILKNVEVGNKSVLSFEKVCPYVRHMDDFLHLKLKVPFGQSVFSVITF